MRRPSELELRHLRTVARIAQHRNLTSAARSMRVSQSALSKQLREIERSLEVRLFTRTWRGMQPTPEGRRTASLAERVLGELASFRSSLRKRATADAGAKPV